MTVHTHGQENDPYRDSQKMQILQDVNKEITVMHNTIIANWVSYIVCGMCKCRVKNYRLPLTLFHAKLPNGQPYLKVVGPNKMTNHGILIKHVIIIVI